MTPNILLFPACVLRSVFASPLGAVFGFAPPAVQLAKHAVAQRHAIGASDLARPNGIPVALTIM